MAETYSKLPVDGALITTATVWLTLPDVAVTVTVPGIVPAVNVAAATPLDVVAEDVIVPKALLLNVNVTAVPSVTFAPVLVVTVAWILDVAVVIIDDGVAVNEMLLAGVAPVETVVPAVVPPAVSLLVAAPHEVNNKTDKSSMKDFNSVLNKDSSFFIFPLHRT